MAMILIMVWDGFLILGEGLGLAGKAQRHFADACWLTLATLLGVWLAALVLLAAPL